MDTWISWISWLVTHLDFSYHWAVNLARWGPMRIYHTVSQINHKANAAQFPFIVGSSRVVSSSRVESCRVVSVAIDLFLSFLDHSIVMGNT